MTTVTAVPIRPLARGAVLKMWIALILLLAAAAGLAWWGTRGMQAVTLESGARYRVLTEGHGPAITPADAFALRYKLHVGSLDAPVIQDSDQRGEPFVATTADVYGGFGEALQRMRAGGRYLLWLPPGTHVTAQTAPPPGSPFGATDTLVFEIEVLQIAPGMASQFQMQRLQQMMQQQQQQGGAPPGGAPPAGGGAPPAGGGAPPTGGGAPPAGGGAPPAPPAGAR
jgi:FKBP-type peptidyl-prolyl cis-trans isomerase FkpA